MNTIQLPEGKGNIYFASDFHLGIPDKETSVERERLIVRWLEEVKQDARAIFLLGDIFDFWFEYSSVVPKGYVRLLGKLAELRDLGIPIHCFTGNHDLWMFGYFENELDIPVYRSPMLMEAEGKRFLLGHGDGIGPGDLGYKFIKKVFANKISQWLFAFVHPNLGIGIANFWSRRSRLANGQRTKEFLGEDKEWLILYCKDILKKEKIDYFIFGHRHLPIDHQINGSKYVNLGDWITYNSYAVFDGQELELKYYQKS